MDCRVKPGNDEIEIHSRGAVRARVAVIGFFARA